MPILWLMSLLAAVGTGWLTFAQTNVSPPVHASFLLSVAAFVGCSVWCLVRTLPGTRDPNG